MDLCFLVVVFFVVVFCFFFVLFFVFFVFFFMYLHLPASRKLLRIKVTPDLHLTYSKNGGNLGLVLKMKNIACP